MCWGPAFSSLLGSPKLPGLGEGSAVVLLNFEILEQGAPHFHWALGDESCSRSGSRGRRPPRILPLGSAPGHQADRQARGCAWLSRPHPPGVGEGGVLQRLRLRLSGKASPRRQMYPGSGDPRWGCGPAHVRGPQHTTEIVPGARQPTSCRSCGCTFCGSQDDSSPSRVAQAGHPRLGGRQEG